MNIRDYLSLLRNQVRVIVVCLVVCVDLAALVTLLLPEAYDSEVTFYVTASSGSDESSASDDLQGAQLATDRIKSYTQLITGPRVAADAADELGGGTTADDVMDAVSSSSVADTVILTLVARGATPERAQAIALAVSDSFTEVVSEVESSRAGQTPDAGSTAPVVTATVLQPADLPSKPASPSLALNLAIGFVLGLLVGFGVAVVRHALDTRIRSGRQLAEVAGVLELAGVPEDGAAAEQPIAFRAGVVDGAAGSRVEAYRRLRIAVQVLGVRGHRRVLVVTSPGDAEGRTTTATNLAVALAAVGARVVLVDGDLRRPQVARVLGLRPDIGLTEVLSRTAELSAAVVPAGPDGLDVLVGGAPGGRASELLASSRTADVLATLREQYDYVIVDSPPVLSVADAASLGTHADGVVLVARWGVTTRSDVEAAVAYLESVSVPVLGTVVNRAPRPAGRAARRREEGTRRPGLLVAAGPGPRITGLLAALGARRGGHQPPAVAVAEPPGDDPSVQAPEVHPEPAEGRTSAATEDERAAGTPDVPEVPDAAAGTPEEAGPADPPVAGEAGPAEPPVADEAADAVGAVPRAAEVSPPRGVPPRSAAPRATPSRRVASGTPARVPGPSGDGRAAPATPEVPPAGEAGRRSPEDDVQNRVRLGATRPRKRPLDRKH